MKQFNRFCQLNIISGGISTFVNADMDLSFNCKKTRSTVPNDLSIDIKNLSESTRKLLNANGAKIRLFVGYDTERILLADMDVTRAVTSWQPPESITKIECLDGFNALKNKKIALSFKAGTSVATVVNALVKQLGLPLRPYTINLTKPLKAGYSHTGTAYQALTDLLSEVGATWGIINDTIVIVQYGQGLGSPKLLITPQNGLLSLPEEIDTTLTTERVQPKVIKEKVTKGIYYVQKRYKKRAKRKKRVEGEIYYVKRGRADNRKNTIETIEILPTEEAKTAGFKLSMLLRPELNPFDLVELNSKFHSGIFVVDEIEHYGGNRTDDFLTIATVYERKP
jgi:hypothetical protein